MKRVGNGNGNKKTKVEKNRQEEPSYCTQHSDL